MPNKIVANEQSYQSIYINPKADNWQEAIVFHEPVFDDEIPGVIALKSLRLENCLGFVLAAPKNRIRYFIEKVKDIDVEEQIGKKKPRDILTRLLSLAEEIGGSVVYIQDENSDAPDEDIPGTKGPEKKVKKKVKKKESEKSKSKQEQETDSLFFDLNEKRRLITDGPVYFDHSLPSMGKEEKEKDTNKFINTSSQLIYSPTANVYPDNINQNNLPIWDKALMVAVGYSLYDLENNRCRWKFVNETYQKLCAELEITPYQLSCLSSKDDIKNDIKNRIGFATQILVDLRNNEKINIRFKDVCFSNDNFQVVLEAKLSPNAMRTAHEKHNFIYAIIGQNKNIIKQLDGRTSITITSSNTGVYSYVTYQLPVGDAENLFDTKDTNKLRCGLIRFVSRLLK